MLSVAPWRSGAVIGAGCAIAAAALVASLPAAPASAHRVAIAAPAAPVMPAAPVAPVMPAAPVMPPATPTRLAPVVKPPVRPHELLFVFSAGGATYVKLADVEGRNDDDHRAITPPPHGKIVASLGADGVVAMVAPVAARQVPAAYAAWRGATLKVDNTCQARIVGFAVVSRWIGDPGHASHDAGDAEGQMADGHRVLAAKLDHCTGTFARRAALPDIAILTRSHDAALEQAAIAAVIASAPARETERKWHEEGQATGGPLVPPWREAGIVTAEVLRHPGTGAIFVSAHARVVGGCGTSDANVWGLFRVVDGKLVTVQLRQLGEMQTIDQVLDVDNDGEPELLGGSRLGDFERLLTRANGDGLGRLSVPYYGCRC